ncbi:hypothetical protein AGR2A_Lc180092 [Agrobacterium genomosp. 2 str. CFBP 5494]|uniref:Uncharacterized protein n=1 Tax=Agrobacterium genomosp. 2 str. CFBP 5494 TaxID=1183436 RepID=A0A9W5B3P5_9HYPH|nr:hypothetical protein AGR2A_Lc180092 [Agrobacterium genomosp. 2 str. CFBP 5494]
MRTSGCGIKVAALIDHRMSAASRFFDVKAVRPAGSDIGSGKGLQVHHARLRR